MDSINNQIDKSNVEQQKAFDLVANTNTCLFITGKAGTGKTTFIKRIQEEINKNFLVLAPTGIAAIAVGGQTMHSFFGFPMQAMGPHTEMSLSNDKFQILKETDTIIVDEASMVRSDMVDGMDRCMRMVFKTNMPFGGKQVIFVGDLFQLPPVNKMRNGEVTNEDLALLNEHVKKDANSDDYSVTLTSFNYMAEKINDEKLNAIEEEEFCYQAEIHDDFKKSDAPVPEFLRLKVGAQVIFCRNYPQAGYMNGTIGKVSKLDEEHIFVTLENGAEINVSRVDWENLQSKYNSQTHKMESEVVGSFTQFPLKLAWAITIHKSQGMTFDKMHFDLSRGTFQAGQAYVAISRLRSLNGLTLSNPICPHHVTQNQEVRVFANSFNDVDMINDELETGKAIYKYLIAKDYNMAAKSCLKLLKRKINKNDLRNAALIAKKMFDIMLDDACLKGMTKDMKLLKDCSMTCNFLNAVICLYGNRYEEAIGYADMVLSRRICLEAMFIKGRALYELKRNDEAYDVVYQIISISKDGEEKKAIDKKLLLFEARVNERIGNSILPFAKQLISLCPEFISSYIMIREEVKASGVEIFFDPEEEHTDMLKAFVDTNISNQDFLKMLKQCDDEKSMKKLRRALSKI